MRSIYARLHRRYGKKITGDQRRHFVEQKLKTTALPEVMPQAKWLAMRGVSALSAGPRPRVAIVGGGFAGLMAGYALANHCDVTMFEARERVGGRVWSKNKPSGVVEAGGELIGYNHPLWLKLARQFELGLSRHHVGHQFRCARARDAALSRRPQALRRPDGADLRRNGRRLRHDEQGAPAAVKPHKPWLRQRRRGSWTRIDCRTGSRGCDARRSPSSRWRSSSPTTPASRRNEQSFLANLAVVAGGALEGTARRLLHPDRNAALLGRQSVAGRIASPRTIKDVGGSVHLSTPVAAIRIDKEGVTLELSRSGSGTARAPFTADYVVLAIPPSLWPGGASPRSRSRRTLPPDYYVSMGTAVKYLSPLKKRFWIGDGLAPTATSNRFGVTWEGTDNQIAPPGAARSSSVCSPAATVAR